MKIEQARNFTEVEKKERKASLARQDSGKLLGQLTSGPAFTVMVDWD